MSLRTLLRRAIVAGSMSVAVGIVAYEAQGYDVGQACEGCVKDANGNYRPVEAPGGCRPGFKCCAKTDQFGDPVAECVPSSGEGAKACELKVLTCPVIIVFG